MIVGVTEWCLDEQEPASVAECAALGFGALQIGIGHDGDERKLTDGEWLRNLRENAREHGVAMAAIALNLLELHGTGESSASGLRARALQLVCAAAAAATQLGASLLYVPAFGRNRIDGDSAFEHSAGFLRSACRIAADHGIALASENTLGAKDNLRLVDAVGQSNFRILVDTYNARLWGHNLRDLVVELQPWLADQAHLKDGIGYAMGCAALGEGEGDVRMALEAFAAIAYRGHFFLENDYRGAGRGRARGDIEYVRQHHRNSAVLNSTSIGA